MEKMLWVSDRLERTRRTARADAPDLASLREAQGHLYAAQSGQAQGRRVPDGYRFQQARQDVYRHLLRAERVLDRMERASVLSRGAPGRPAAYGRGGLLLISRDLTLLVDPDRGGQIVELSDKVTARNLLDVQAGPVPPVRRAALVDHLLPEGTGLDPFLRGRSGEASGFSSGRYEGRVKRSGSSVQAVLMRKGTLPAPGSSAVAYTKTVALSPTARTMRVRQRLRTLSSRRQSFLFATEINLGLKDAHVNRVGEADGIRRFAMVDPAARLQVSWSLGRSARLWYFPLESGSGLDRIYQGVRLAWVWPVRLSPRRTWEIRWEMTIGTPDGAAQI